MSDDRGSGNGDPADIRTIAVTTDDVVTALEATRRGAERAVLRVTPPFAGRMRARLHRERSAEYAGEPAPIHIDPERFVEGVPPVPDPDRTEDELRASGAAYTPEAHRERHVEAVAAWRRTVRKSLVDAIELETASGTRRVAVKALG